MDTPQLSGWLLDIQRSSMHDGPGIRTTVFLKGCPLSCKWCHNPESQKFSPQLAYFTEKCTLCRRCESVCSTGAHTFSSQKHSFDRNACIQCGKCAKACPSGALKLFGYQATVEEVMAVVRKDKKYYDASSGGLTVSGGEPFAQFSFTLALLKAAREEGIHTCVETCGYASTEQILAFLPYVDYYLFDYKLTNDELHQAYTGVSNQKILYHLDLLYTHHAKIRLRCPIIPGVNDTPEHFAGIHALEVRYPDLCGIEIMPYHDMGKPKATALCRANEIEAATASQAQKDAWRREMARCGCSESILNSF